jgi:hypothetical protein
MTSRTRKLSSCTRRAGIAGHGTHARSARARVRTGALGGDVRPMPSQRFVGEWYARNSQDPQDNVGAGVRTGGDAP